MTRIAFFGATTPGDVQKYAQNYGELLSRGRAIDETANDKRNGIAGAVEFQQDTVQINVSLDKQQVVLSEKVGVEGIRDEYLPDHFSGEAHRQTFRSVIKPDSSRVLHVTERVDTRNSLGEVEFSWVRHLEKDLDSDTHRFYFSH